MHGALVLPTDPRILGTFGAGLAPWPIEPAGKAVGEESGEAAKAEAKRCALARRALNARLRRAERGGLLPRRVYLSSQRFAYPADELEKALAKLPERTYLGVLGGGDPLVPDQTAAAVPTGVAAGERDTGLAADSEATDQDTAR